MATPLNMPKSKTRLVAIVTMATKHAHCQDKGLCKGPGCKVSTGKTSRKASERVGHYER
jgi:hypothetical protein